MRATDPDLAAKAARGDRKAFGELVARHQATVRGLLRRLTGSTADADDLSQAAFLKAWTQVSSYGGGQFRSWLCAIAYREFLQARRRSATRRRKEIESGAENIIVFSRDNAGLAHDLDRALASLPEAQRVAVTLCIGAGLSHGEAALVTGWPLGTVKSHVNRGKTALRDLLSSYNVA